MFPEFRGRSLLDPGNRVKQVMSETGGYGTEQQLFNNESSAEEAKIIDKVGRKRGTPSCTGITTIYRDNQFGYPVNKTKLACIVKDGNQSA